MSWAATRKTTRVEDRAYILMGLFDVNIPMIYGEREKTFLRLQYHIIEKSKDESIFAWGMEFPGNTRTCSGIFASSPLAFIVCSEIIQTQGSRGFSEINGEVSMTVKAFSRSIRTYFAMFHCTDTAQLEERVSILISKTSAQEEYVRVRVGKGQFACQLIQSNLLSMSSTDSGFELSSLQVMLNVKQPYCLIVGSRKQITSVNMNMLRCRRYCPNTTK